jgi:nucleoside transporter
MIMMFLQFFIWGSWYATAGNYMSRHGMSDIIYLAYLVSPIGSIVSPFFSGMIADRFFAVQKVMGFMHIFSGIFVICAPLLGEVSPTIFLTFLLFHMLFYMPTVGLATATAFHLVTDKERDFPLIRLFGTIGWISAGIIVSYFLHADTSAIPLYTAGIGGIVMGFYSFTLPNVPPKGAVKAISFRDIVGIDAWKQLQSKSFIIFVAGLFLISIPFASYFAYVPLFLRTAGVADPAFKMTFGQMSEVIFLLMMPFLFRRLGIKGVLMIGLIAWAIRYGLFTLGAPDSIVWMIIVGIVLHGACYDFVYVASQVYMDQKATPGIRAQAQGLFVLISYGIGQGIGTLVSGWMFKTIMAGTEPTLEQWKVFWTIPLVFAVIVSVMFGFGFKEEVNPAIPSP